MTAFAPDRERLATFVLCLLLTVLPVTSLCAQDAADAEVNEAAEAPQDPSPGAVPIPDGILDGGTSWLNTSEPISLKDLRGKVVLFDFWTYCCINCMHVLPELKYLEEKYPNELVVIGVHSAKFDNEKDTDAIRDAIMRHGIVHPVVNDSEMEIWRRFQVKGWPTLALVDPQGRYLGSRSGEGNRDLFDEVIGKVIDYHRAIGKLNEDPIVFDLESNRSEPTALRYPGKILADAESQRLFISDTSHNRLVITDLDGEVQHVIGSGQPGHRDGSFDDAQFDHPQGTCLVDSTLYVADTENHLLRAVDLQSRTVSTLAGTGEQGRPRSPTGALRETALNSPWSICHIDGMLYIAMAGPHQLWSHQLGTNSIEVFAGNAQEDVINGPHAKSSFAQPSGLVVSSDSSAIFVVDSEGSAIRRVPADLNGRVTTVAGTSELPRGQSLFAFGDIDATGDAARFQHPIGITRHNDLLYVADSYNHKIRVIDPQSTAVTTLIGDGTAGDAESTDRLSEPAGLSMANATLYIADTNNHRICVYDLKSDQLSILKLTGLTAPTKRAVPAALQLDRALAVPDQLVRPGQSVNIRVELAVPTGGHLNELAPVTWQVQPISGQLLDSGGPLNGKATVEQTTASFQLPLAEDGKEGEFAVSVSYGYCNDDDDLCRLATCVWKITARSDPQADATLQLTVPATSTDQ